MSVGNIKSEGTKGNNFTWQLKVLQGLQALLDSRTDDQCCNQLIELLQPRPKKVRVSSVENTDGETSDGASSVSIANVGAAAGLVGTASIPAGVTLNFDAGVLNNTLTSISYDATGTTFLITEMM